MPDLPLGGVLALDLASTVGYAYGDLAERLPVAFGIWKLPKVGGEGARYAAFENMLSAMCERVRPSKLILEAPLPLMAQTQGRIAQQQYTLRGFAYAEGYRQSATVLEVSADLVRNALLGRSRFGTDKVKVEVVAYVRRLGLRVPEHNSADAAMVWLWLRGQLHGTRSVSGPLFQERRHA